MLPLITSTTSISSVSITATEPSAHSATNRVAPVGDSATPVGSEPTAIGADTVGVPSIWVMRTTVASPLLATHTVVLSGEITTELGSSPVVSLWTRPKSSAVASKIATESSSGLTIATQWSSSLIATVLDFDGRLSTGTGSGLASTSASGSTSSPTGASSLQAPPIASASAAASQVV